MYIIDFSFSVTECTCKLTLTETPDMPQIEKELIFSDVGDVSIKRYHEVENCLGDYLGLKIKQLMSNRAEFRVDTGDALVTFEASSTYKTNETNKQ